MNIFFKYFNKIPIRRQVTFGFATSIFFLLVVILFMFFNLNKIDLKENDMLQIESLNDNIDNIKHNLLREEFIVMELLESDYKNQVRNWESEQLITSKELISNINSAIKLAKDPTWGINISHFKQKVPKELFQIKSEVNSYIIPTLNTIIKISYQKTNSQNINIYKKKLSDLDTQFDLRTISTIKAFDKLENEVNKVIIFSKKSLIEISFKVKFFMTLTAIISILISLLFAFLIISRLQQILGADPQKVSFYINEITAGKIDFKIENEKPVGLLATIILLHESIKNKIDFTSAISQGKFDAKIDLASDQDVFGKGLLKMATSLRANQKQISDLLLYQKAILDSTEQAIITTDEKGIITQFNKGAEKMYGYSAEELIGVSSTNNFYDTNEIIEKAQHLNPSLKIQVPLGIEIFIAKALENGFDEREWTNIKKDGTRFQVNKIIKPIFNSKKELIGFNSVTTDITERKEYENTILIAKKNAEELAKAKDEFMSNMSHEIRTPLNGILGFTNMLLKDKKISLEQIKQLEAIKTSGDILLVIINDILDLSKIEAGKMNIEKIPVDLKKISEQVIDTFSVKIQEKNLNVQLKFDKSIDSEYETDPVRLSQILLNFMSNAIKFTPEKGIITISIQELEKKDNFSKLELSIQDSGIGIAEDKLSSVFDAFTQTSEDTARKYGGTGLGLTIVKKITELMGGKVKANSEIGIGTKFSVILTLNKIKSKRKETDTLNSIENDSRDLSLKNLKLLLVEDNPINQLLAQTVLAQFEANVITAENGLIAIEKVKEDIFDIILMDLMMPEMDGYEASEQIRKLDDPIKSKIPIIALTADVTNEVTEKCNRIGMNEYVSKPFDANELKNKIITLINKRDESN